MAREQVPAKAATIKRSVEEPSHSDSLHSDSDSNSSSDSLDSQASRKRFKVTPVDGQERLPAAFSAPSRIKSKPAIKHVTDHTLNGPISVPTDPQTSFADLNIKPWLVGSLGSMAIKRPTGIQKLCIPEILKGRDCIGGSRTGSGKTVAFAVPILQKWAEDPFGIFALVLTPTRYGTYLRLRDLKLTCIFQGTCPTDF